MIVDRTTPLDLKAHQNRARRNVYYRAGAVDQHLTQLVLHAEVDTPEVDVDQFLEQLSFEVREKIAGPGPK